MRYKSIRACRVVGKAIYISIPRLARLEMRLFPGDWVEMELDTDTKILTLKPVHAREEVPLITFVRPDMVPATAAAVPPPIVRKPHVDQPQLAELAS